MRPTRALCCQSSRLAYGELCLDVAPRILGVPGARLALLPCLEPSWGYLAPYNHCSSTVGSWQQQEGCGHIAPAALSLHAPHLPGRDCGSCCPLPGLPQPFLYTCFY